MTLVFALLLLNNQVRLLIVVFILPERTIPTSSHPWEPCLLTIPEPVQKDICIHAFFIKNLARGLVLKIPYFPTSFYQILVLKVP